LATAPGLKAVFGKVISAKANAIELPRYEGQQGA
jgi:hypothetical protein